MIKLLIGMLIYGISISYSAVSIHTTQNLLNQLTSANNLKPIKIHVLNDSRINAYGAPNYVAVNSGLLRHGSRSMMVFILAHELSHTQGMKSEVGADMASVELARKAGMNVCPGAKQFLHTTGKVGGGSHPPGLVRLHRMGCD